MFTALALTAAAITTPLQEFGHNLGDDYFLANYQQLTQYWHKLDRESDRMQVFTIGKSEEGRDQLMAVVSAPENMRHLQLYRQIARRLCLAKGLTDGQAWELAHDGKAVVWIDGGLHASEVLGAQQLMETCYQLVSRNDDETKRILKDTIVLLVQANPDGQDLCADWYMRNPDPNARSLANLPRLYQKYIGHDNNRDFYASTQSETTNMNRVMYHDWFPQIVYNHHQTGPAGTVLFQPPFRDPINFNFDPLVVSQLELVGANMMNRFVAEDKPGATMRSGSNYSTWWNGGLRTTCYFHNMVGLLTETIGSPTPTRVPFVPDKLLMKNDLPFPIQPQEWHFRQSIDYSVTANYSVLDIASKNREQFLYNIYQAGRNSIRRGSQDSWTDTPSRIELARKEGFSAMRRPDLRDPRAYVIPADRPGFENGTAMVNALLKVGVEVQRAKAPFATAGNHYPAGSYVVRCDQAFRPHILDMFEPQDHPNDLAYPGGPPIPPYDSAGYTLAFQMAVPFDRLLDGPPAGDFETLTEPFKPEGSLSGQGSTFTTRGLTIESYGLAADVMRRGGEAVLSPEGFVLDRGTLDLDGLRKLARNDGADLVASGPATGGYRLRLPRVALWDRYGGSMSSGWIRWLLEQYHIPFTVVYAPDIDRGLTGKYDVLILPSDASISTRAGREVDPASIPEEYRNRLGALSRSDSLPRIKEFVVGGGSLLAIGPAARIAEQLGLDVKNALVDADGKVLSRTEFYIPGSVMRVQVDPKHPIAWGMKPEVDVMFDDDPAFIVGQGIEKIGWYPSKSTLRSGWANGQQYLDGAAAVAHGKIGKGDVYLFGPEITFRAQPRGTFKLLFNGIFLSAGTPMTR